MLNRRDQSEYLQPQPDILAGVSLGGRYYEMEVYMINDCLDVRAAIVDIICV